jgi:virginiamycin B lyase
MAAGPNGVVYFTGSASGPNGSVTNEISAFNPATGTFQHWIVPTKPGYFLGLGAITVAPNNMVFAVADLTNSVVQLNPATGAIKTIAIPTPNSGASYIAAAASGDLYLTEANVGKIAILHQVTDTITEYAVPNPAHYSLGLGAITTTSNGNAWFADGLDDLWMMNAVTHQFTSFHIPIAYRYSVVPGITVSPAGKIWFTLQNGVAYLGELDPISGGFTMTLLPRFSNPGAITSSPDGKLWFLDNATDATGHSTPRIDTFNPIPNTLSEAQVTTPFTELIGIAYVGGTVDFSDFENGLIGVINTTTGVLKEWRVP